MICILLLIPGDYFPCSFLNNSYKILYNLAYVPLWSYLFSCSLCFSYTLVFYFIAFCKLFWTWKPSHLIFCLLEALLFFLWIINCYSSLRFSTNIAFLRLYFSLKCFIILSHSILFYFFHNVYHNYNYKFICLCIWFSPIPTISFQFHTIWATTIFVYHLIIRT